MTLEGPTPERRRQQRNLKVSASAAAFIIGFVILVGWLLARLDIVNQEGRLVLNKTSFFAASPALLFMVLSEADVGLLFSSVLAVALLAFAGVALVYIVVARIWLTKDPARIALAASASGYSNVNNIGLPVAIYVIGDAGFVGPLLLLALLSFLCFVAGALACLVGLLVAYPVVTVAAAYTYRRLQGQPVAP